MMKFIVDDIAVLRGLLMLACRISGAEVGLSVSADEIKISVMDRGATGYLHVSVAKSMFSVWQPDMGGVISLDPVSFVRILKSVNGKVIFEFDDGVLKVSSSDKGSMKSYEISQVVSLETKRDEVGFPDEFDLDFNISFDRVRGLFSDVDSMGLREITFKWDPDMVCIMGADGNFSKMIVRLEDIERVSKSGMVDGNASFNVSLFEELLKAPLSYVRLGIVRNEAPLMIEAGGLGKDYHLRYMVAPFIHGGGD